MDSLLLEFETLAQQYLKEKEALTPEIEPSKSQLKNEVDAAIAAYNNLAKVLDASSPILQVNLKDIERSHELRQTLL
jgi:hypothetical protein